MTLHVLGTVDFDGEQLSPRERTVLAALAVSIPYGASASTLADALWGENLPSTWPKQLQAIIGLIRRAIGAGAIQTTAAGYALAVDADSLDAARFEQLVETARRHTAADDPERAAAAYRRALELWRGPAFAELADWEPAAAESSRLETVRHTTEEELLAARLAIGEHRAAIAEAERLVRESPYREERWCLLALANYQSGRQAEALAALRTARRQLDDDLGIEPGERLRELETAILRHDPSLAPARHEPRISDECPYRGLGAYGPDDAEEFFGRDAEIETVVERLTRRRFLALTGASGSGKSSLALAGAVPALVARGWQVEIVGPGDEIHLDVAGSPDPHATIVDQFEELFALGLSDLELEALGERLESYVRGGGHLLLTVRSDFLDRCAAIPALARLIAEGVQIVGPLSKDALRLAIEGPAAQAGLRLESGLTELVLRDAQGAPAALPLLSHALVETWLRREGSVLTVAGYEASGGISGAIAQSADDLYATLSPEEQAICRSTMLRLVSRGPDGSAVRRRVASGPLVQDRERRDVLARLTRARLITAQDDSIVVAHEAIASAWPRLGAWLEEDAEGARVSEHLTLAADQWSEAGMPDSDLYRGARLAATEEWIESARPSLTADESSFVDASAKVAQSERRAAEARAALDRRNNRRLRLALTSVAVLLVASLGATGVAVAGGAAAARSAEAAKAAETDATIEALMGTSLALRDSQRDVAALLAAELWHRWPGDPRARAALMGVVTASAGLLSTSYVDAGWIAGRIVPGTANIALVRDGTELELRDIHSGEVAATSASPVDGYEMSDQIAMSADGSRIAVVLYPQSDEDEQPIQLAVLDASDLTLVGKSIVLSDFPQGLAVDTDGSTAAAVYRGAIVEVIDSATGATRLSEPFVGPDDIPEYTNSGSIAFAPDGRLVLGTIHPELLFLDPVDFSITASAPVAPYSANQDSTLTSDGVLVASGERATTAVDTVTGRTLWSHELETPKPLTCARVAASTSAGTLYCGDDWGGIVEYDLATGMLTGNTFDPQLGQTRAIDLTTDGTELLAIGQGTPTLSLWRTDGGGAVTSIGAHGQVMLDGYGISGDSIVVAERPADAHDQDDLGDVSVWAPTDDRTVVEPQEEMDGMGWAGPNLLSGFSIDADELVALDATTGVRVPSDSIPESAFHTWVSPVGDRVYTANFEESADSRHGFVSVYSGETAKLLDVAFDLDEAYPWWVSASEDNSQVAITRWIEGVATTGIFDGRTGKILVDGLEGPTVTAITPSGELLGARDGRMTRHDLNTLERTGTIPGAGGEINSLQVSRDGQTLLTTSNDETVTLYDLPSGRRLGDPIPASAPLIGQGALRPDGLQFVVNVADGIQVWDADATHQIEAACRIAGRELSADERSTYLASLPERTDACEAILR